MDVTYLGSGSSVLAVAGQCNKGGNIVIWDTQRPVNAGPVARLSYHVAAVTALKVPALLPAPVAMCVYIHLYKHQKLSRHG